MFPLLAVSALEWNIKSVFSILRGFEVRLHNKSFQLISLSEADILLR